jgi:UDP-N-acetylglucosamine/UDP-N-acetylgalactosamine 4-epimerase
VNSIQHAVELLRNHPRTWLVTGAAGFIGSHLTQRLLELDQWVVGLDNFSTGFRNNLDDVRSCVGDAAEKLRFIEGDIRDLETCREACAGVEIVLHQAALGSVPRSIENPIATHESNVDGFLNILVAARDAGVQRFVYAASSSTYGDHPALPKKEEAIGRPLSPYAVTKYVNELYAGVFTRVYGLEAVGLRYFNVFGPRQDPSGAYAAVIPRWIGQLFEGVPCQINGDGETSRDFCYVENAIQANLVAATADHLEGPDLVYNVSCGGRTTLNELFRLIRGELREFQPDVAGSEPVYAPLREGDVRHSQADISRARQQLGYQPAVGVEEGIHRTVRWFAEDRLAAPAAPSP